MITGPGDGVFEGVVPYSSKLCALPLITDKIYSTMGKNKDTINEIKINQTYKFLSTLNN